MLANTAVNPARAPFGGSLISATGSVCGSSPRERSRGEASPSAVSAEPRAGGSVLVGRGWALNAGEPQLRLTAGDPPGEQPTSETPVRSTRLLSSLLFWLLTYQE